MGPDNAYQLPVGTPVRVRSTGPSTPLWLCDPTSGQAVMFSPDGWEIGIISAVRAPSEDGYHGIYRVQVFKDGRELCVDYINGHWLEPLGVAESRLV